MGVFGGADSISGLKKLVRGHLDPSTSLKVTSQRSNPGKKVSGPVFFTKASQICPRCRFRGFWGC